MDRNRVQPVRLTSRDAHTAGTILARAFQEFSLMRFFHPDPEERLRSLSATYTAMVRYGIRHGEAYATSPEMEGAIMWLPSEKARMTFWRNLQSGQLNWPWKRKNPLRVVYTAFINEVRERCVPGPHLHFRIVGVQPEYRGKGYSSALIRLMLDKADAAQRPVYLETQSEKNVAIYEHLGFRIVDEDKVPGVGMPSWGMLREPEAKEQL